MSKRAIDGVAVGLVAGFILDRLIGDPQRWHPVAGFGRIAVAAQRPLYADSRAAGVAYETLLVGGSVLGARVLARGPAPTVAAAAVTWAVLGGRSLHREAAAVHELVRDGDLPGARLRVRSLVGRDPSELDGDALGRACVESIAENTSDAVIGPLVWGAIGGIPGLVGYRVINTLDAMVGHRTPRWERFGWAAARLDDVANLLPARLGTVLAALLSGRPKAVLAVVRRDAPAHPSPNAGPIEAAFAETLGVRLGGSNVYAGQREDRGFLGDGPPAGIEHVQPAIRLSRRLSWASLAAVITARVLGRALLRRRPPGE